MIKKELLNKFYIDQKKSVSDIANFLNFSESKVNYWLKEHAIKKRSISDALYLKKNPNGNPFKINKPKSIGDALLFGLGLGLYWGEGNKRNKLSIRLGNTDPRLIKKFILFLEKICNINREKLKFGLQIFNDINPEEALYFWQKELGFDLKYFQKPVVTLARGRGTYKRKTEFGVLTVYYHNKKLRNIICKTIEMM